MLRTSLTRHALSPVRRIAMTATYSVVLGVVFLLPLFGCGKDGPRHYAVSGSVQLDGKPLEKGSIRLTPTKGTKGQTTGGVIKEGKYELRGDVGPLAGFYAVEIHSTRKTGKKVPAPYGRPDEQEMVDEYEEAVAPSRLEVEIKPGDNIADFDVTSR